MANILNSKGDAQMSKQYSKYFKATIEALIAEPKKYLERVSFWRTIEKTKDEYYMLCSLQGAGEDFKLKVKIEKEEYEASKIGDEVRIHLNFSYDFTCFISIKREEKPEVLTIEKSY